MQIRHAVEKDLESIKVIYEKAFYGMDGILMYYPNFSEYVRNCINLGVSYVAVVEDKVCGMSFAYEVPDIECGKSLYIDILAVLPEYQKRGIGKALLNHLKKVAKEEGYMELSLRTACYLDAYEIYKKIGFKDMKSDRRFMVLKLGKEESGALEND